MERMEELFKPNGNWFTGWKAKVDLTAPPPGLDEKLAHGGIIDPRTGEKHNPVQEQVERV